MTREIRWVRGDGLDDDRWYVPSNDDDECAVEHVMRTVTEGQQWWVIACENCTKTMRLRKVCDD